MVSTVDETQVSALMFTKSSKSQFIFPPNLWAKQQFVPNTHFFELQKASSGFALKHIYLYSLPTSVTNI